MKAYLLKATLEYSMGIWEESREEANFPRGESGEGEEATSR